MGRAEDHFARVLAKEPKYHRVPMEALQPLKERLARLKREEPEKHGQAIAELHALIERLERS